MPDVHQLSIDTIRTLAMDAVQAANSGHPGMPMGCSGTWRGSVASWFGGCA